MDISALVAEALLSGRADAIIAADRAGIIRFWNPGAERLLGYARQEALRQRHWDGYNQVIQTGHSRYYAHDGLITSAFHYRRNRVQGQFARQQS